MPAITDDSILEETLRNSLALRSAICTRYKWFYHITSTENVDGIRSQGLLPHSDAGAPPSVVAAFGIDGRNIVCVNPLGTDIVPPPVQPPPYICLAFENKALPPRIGLDWSYTGAVGIARVLRDEAPNRPVKEIFVEAVKRWGSMIVYDLIPRDELRVCAKGYLPHDPQKWPMLTGTTNADLMHFG